MTKRIDIRTDTGRAWIRVAKGVVKSLDKQTWTETHVHSTGGGGHVGPQGGYVSPANVYSTTTEHQLQSFWILEDSGQEVHVELRNTAFRAAVGHRVKVAWGAGASSDSGQYLFAENINSRNFQEFINDWSTWGRRQSIVNYPLVYRILTRGIPLAIGLFMLIVLAPVFDHVDPRTLTDRFNAFTLAPSLKSATALAFVDHWSTWSPSMAFDWYRLEPGRGWYALLFSTVVWLALCICTFIIGQFSFGMHWRRARAKALRHKFVIAFRDA